MGYPVGYLAIIKLLNSSKNLSYKIADLCEELTIKKEDVLFAIKEFNKLFNLVEKKEETLILKRKLDLLDEDLIFKQIVGAGRVLVLESVDSTNTYTLKNTTNVISGDTVFAEIQTAGRGRRGGKWISGFARQLTFSTSYIFDNVVKIQGLSIGIGVAVANAIESFGINGLKIKWPNDIYINDCKVGGILIEVATDGSKVKAVIGVGLNVYTDNLAVTDRRYCSLAEGPSDTFNRNLLATALINSIKDVCFSFLNNDRDKILTEFNQRDYLKGKQISIQTEQGIVQGVAYGIDSTGAILLNTGESICSVNVGHIL